MQTWVELAAAQAGALSWRQLRQLGVSRGVVRNKVSSGRWQRRTEEVLTTTKGPLPLEQRRWVAVLHCGEGSMIGGLTAAALHGLSNASPRRSGSRAGWSCSSRTDSSGRGRFTDCEWTLSDGRTLVLEVDGGFHADVDHYEGDVQRQRRLTTPSRVVVRCTSQELRREPWLLAADLRALGVPLA